MRRLFILLQHVLGFLLLMMGTIGLLQSCCCRLTDFILVFFQTSDLLLRHETDHLNDLVPFPPSWDCGFSVDLFYCCPLRGGILPSLR